jgi:hypothetical protein
VGMHVRALLDCPLRWLASAASIVDGVAGKVWRGLASWDSSAHCGSGCVLTDFSASKIVLNGGVPIAWMIRRTT